jgi:hypothetical protein
MFSFYRSVFYTVFILFFVIGCGSNNDNSNRVDTPTYTEFQIASSDISTLDLYPNANKNVNLEIYSPQDYNFDDDNASMFFFFGLENINDANQTYWFDASSFSNIEKGLHNYSFNITIPWDINISSYRFIIEVSDSNEIITNFTSLPFSINFHDGTPDLELLSFSLDLENGTVDDEYDTINSSEINSTENLDALINTGLTLYSLNQPLYAGATIDIKSNFQAIENVKVKACVEIGSVCIDVPMLNRVDSNGSLTFDMEDANETILSDINNSYLDELLIGSISENESLSVDLHIQLTPENLQSFVDEIVSNISLVSGNVVEGTIHVELYSNNEGSLNTQNNKTSYPFNVTLTDEVVADVLALYSSRLSTSSTHTLRSSPSSGECGLKKLNFEETYERYKYGDKFGAGAYLLGRAYLDIEGVHAKTYASIRVKRFSDTKFRLLRVNATADIIPGSFEDTGYDIALSSLGVNFYNKSFTLNQLTGLTTPLVTLSVDEERRIATANSSSSDNNETNETNTTVTNPETLLRQKRYKAVKDKLREYKINNTTEITLVSISDNFRVGKWIEKKQTIMFSIIPVVVTAGAEARVGFDTSIGLDGITSMTAMIEPNAYIGAYVRAGVGAALSCCYVDIEYSAGVGGDLWLVSERFTANVTGSLDLVEDGDYIVALDGNLHENITNYINTMHGKIYAYATYYGPYRFSEPFDSDWKNRTKRKNFANWGGGQYTSELLDARQTLFTIPIADECD